MELFPRPSFLNSTMFYNAMLSLVFAFVSFVYAFERRQVGAPGGNGVLTAQNFLRRGFHACGCIKDRQL